MTVSDALSLRRDPHLDQLADNLQEERVRQVVEPLLAGAHALGLSEHDLEHVRHLGLVARDRRLRIANSTYAEAAPWEAEFGDGWVPPMTRADVDPKLLTWARERAGISQTDLLRKFPKLIEWEHGELSPTFKQLEDFARATFVPFGYLFLADPPEEKIPIPHYRSERDTAPRNPSPDLLDTIYMLERRQMWMRRHLIEQGCARLPYVASATVHDSVEVVVDNMRDVLDIDSNWAEGQHTWQEALARLRNRMERAGVFVVSNGVVGNNTRRKLDVSEFRGFVLADEYAPFVFVNGGRRPGSPDVHARSRAGPRLLRK